jgi:hypothetical protein
MDSFVPRLQWSSSRVFGGDDDRLAARSRLNETAAPFHSSGLSGVGDGGRGGGANSSNNNTSMTNNTMSSDMNNDGGYGAWAAPPSPVPRFSGKLDSARCSNFDATRGYPSWQQGWAEQQKQQPTRYTDAVQGRPFSSSSGSRSTPGPSTMRPLFTSVSASSPRDTNVIVGDTGRAVLPGGMVSSSAVSAGAAPEPREEFLNRYRRSYGDGNNSPGRCSSYGYGAPRGSSALFGPSRPPTNAFTSTYVGTSTGAMPANKPTFLGGAGVSGFDWRGGTRSLATRGGGGDSNGVSPRLWQEERYGNSSSDDVNGLVNSRSRVRTDRWTGESADDPLGESSFGEDDMTSLDAVAPPSDASSSPSALSSRRHRRGTRRHRRHDGDGSSGGEGGSDDPSEDADDMWDPEDADPLSFADAVVKAMDAQPVVPLELLRKAQETPFIWIRHPSHGIILSLLQHRGIYLPRYRELVDYHMAELFLHYIDLCREGSYFVYYAPSKWPKERFFRIRMLPVNRLEAGTEPVPHLVITLHESGVHILDAIPLDNLVGVTVTPQAACFRPFLESPNTIIGCREGRGHRARMPVDGAFSLWFYDIRQHTSRSVDILTCDAKVFDIWTKTFRGLVSVNSSSVVQVAMTPQGESVELAGLTQAAQEQSEIDHGERKGKYTED